MEPALKERRWPGCRGEAWAPSDLRPGRHHLALDHRWPAPRPERSPAISRRCAALSNRSSTRPARPGRGPPHGGRDHGASREPHPGLEDDHGPTRSSRPPCTRGQVRLPATARELGPRLLNARLHPRRRRPSPPAEGAPVTFHQSHARTPRRHREPPLHAHRPRTGAEAPHREAD